MKEVFGDMWDNYKNDIRTWWTANADRDSSLEDVPNREGFRRVLAEIDGGNTEAHTNDGGENDEQCQDMPDMDQEQEFKRWVKTELHRIEETEERMRNDQQITCLVEL